MYRWHKSTDVQQPTQWDKTEAIFFSTRCLSCHCLPSSVMVGTHETVFSHKFRNLGFVLDSNLTTKQHVIKFCQTAFCELKCISSIRRYLTEDAVKQLVTSCVLSRYRLLQFSPQCNSLLNSIRLPPSCYSTDIKSTIYCCTPYSQSTPPSKLHTFPTATPLAPNFWTSKILNSFCMCCDVMTEFAASYLSELLDLYSLSSSVRSSSDTRMLKLQRFNRSV